MWLFKAEDLPAPLRDAWLTLLLALPCDELPALLLEPLRDELPPLLLEPLCDDELPPLLCACPSCEARPRVLAALRLVAGLLVAPPWWDLLVLVAPPWWDLPALEDRLEDVLLDTPVLRDGVWLPRAEVEPEDEAARLEGEALIDREALCGVSQATFLD